MEGNLPTILIASILFYAGGVALNDVCDASLDAVERPERPIPSGRISKTAATRLAVTLLGIGTLLAINASLRTSVLAGFLVSAIVLYNLHAKATAWGPVVMGSCRALNFAMGLSALESLASPAALAPVGLMGLYVASVTYFARDEASVSTKSRLIIGTVGVMLAALGLSSLLWLLPEGRTVGAILAIPLAGVVGWVGIRAACDPTPVQVQGSVRSLLILLIAFDAVLAGIAAGPVAVRNVALLGIPMIAITKRFRAT